jgi:hypothetical protein
VCLLFRLLYFLNNLSTGGGPVFSVSVTVLSIRPLMSRVKRRTKMIDIAAKNRIVVGDSESLLTMVLSEGECGELKHVLERAKQRVVDSLEDAPELRFAALVESMGCDDSVVEDLKVDFVVVITICFSINLNLSRNSSLAKIRASVTTDSSSSWAFVISCKCIVETCCKA